MIQKILKLYNKLKSSKGATGADIVVALSTIVLTIGVISVIYVNLSYGSKKVSRTAGATRIATNIIENIKSLNYDDVSSTLDSLETKTGITKSSTTTTATIEINGKDSGGTASIFNTKIPKGYNLELVFTKISDTSTPETDRKTTIDLIKKIDVTVSFEVRNKKESVSLSSSIERETSKDVNSPDLTKLSSIGTVLPIKYSSIMGTYVPTTESDSEWYNYSNKIWAMVYVDTEDNVNTVKNAGKLDIKSLSSNIYYWIPRFSSNSNIALFGTTNNIINTMELSTSDDKKLIIYTKSSNTAILDSNFTDNSVTGVWTKYTTTLYTAFESTKYGPPRYQDWQK
jgi:hypothetical protein